VEEYKSLFVVEKTMMSTSTTSSSTAPNFLKKLTRGSINGLVTPTSSPAAKIDNHNNHNNHNSNSNNNSNKQQ